MYLNSLQPAAGSKFKSKRLGRGIGSGKGKTCGRGHKGQRARAGGYHKVGFEGGQMPMQRRIPKSGFHSRKSMNCDEVYLSDISKLNETVIDLNILIAHGLVHSGKTNIKIILAGSINRAVTIRGLMLTKGARHAIEAAKGKIEA